VWPSPYCGTPTTLLAGLAHRAYEVDGVMQRSQQLDRMELREQEEREVPALHLETREMGVREGMDRAENRITPENRVERERPALEARRTLLLEREQERQRRLELTLANTRERVQLVREDVVTGNITSREDLVQKREELAREANQRAKEGIIGAIQNMEKAVRNGLDNLKNNIAPRIGSRISALADEGKNVERARSAFSHAMEHIEEAERILRSLSLDIEAMNGSESHGELREAFAKARETVTKAREEVREARTEFAETLQILKNL
jgi:hypothetical protein